MACRLQLIKHHIAQDKKNVQLQEVYIVAAKRTPIGAYMGKLSSFKAPELGAIAIKAALKSIKLNPEEVDEVIMGNVLSAGVGQAPARQAAILAGLRLSATCTTVNKVCSSAMKSVHYAYQSIALGDSQTTVAGGFQSMSNAPHLVMKARKGVGHGDKTLVDSLTFDGLTDPFKGISMGLCAQKTAAEIGLTRQDQDAYCKLTYQRHINAQSTGQLRDQIVPVQISIKGKSEVLERDEEATRYRPEALSKLKPAFKKDGTITSANSSKINDGACCIVMMSAQKAQSEGIKPLVRIVAYADAQIESVDFCKSPYYATLKVLKQAGLKVEDIDFFEFNEAFCVVPLTMMKLLGVSNDKINVMGGSVSMGHPIGVSGARIIQSLITTLKLKGGRLGLAAICNGGGGSSAIIVENVQ